MKRTRDDEDDLGEDIPLNGMGQEGPEQWTPTRVGKALVWALKIARTTAGATHPRSYGSGMPQVAYSVEEIREMEVEDRRRPPTAGDITRADSALFWQSRYLSADAALVDISAILKVWLRCRVNRRSFGLECDDRGWSRATAYRRRDRALSVISQGLDQDRVPVWRA